MPSSASEQDHLLSNGAAALATDNGTHHNNNFNDEDHPQDDERHTKQFFAFICISTALRSFEAGIVASMMADIQNDLHLDYTAEGTIVASTDYGIALGSLAAILVFRRCSVRRVLSTTMFGMALCAFGCVWNPTKGSLLLARSVGGLLWAQAATHYPVWINDRGRGRGPRSKFTDRRKTIWLACTNVCLLVGVISGYIVGGVVRSARNHVRETHDNDNRGSGFIVTLLAHCTWVDLYFSEGILMMLCGVIVMFCFDGELLSIGTTPSSTNAYQQRQRNGIQQDYSAIESTDNTAFPTTNTPQIEQESEDLKEVVTALVKSPPFVLAVAITGCISGGIVYALYFVTQVCEARGMEVGTTLLFVTGVFVTAPAPGIIFGSWIVSTLGGCTDHVVTFGVALGSAIFVLCSAIALPISWAIWGTWKVPFVTAFWIFAFAGAMSGPPLNGVAVSAVPHASHVASALQFSLSNAAKIIVPQIGGYVCHRVGLIDGFHATLVATATAFVGLSWIGLLHALKARRSTGDSITFQDSR